MILKSVAKDGLPTAEQVCWVFFDERFGNSTAMLARYDAHFDQWSSAQDGHEGGGVYGEVTHYFEMPSCLADAL